MNGMTGQASDKSTTRFWLAVTFVIILVQIVSQYLMGRIWICECGYVKLFEAGVNTPGNSQHLFDWYTPSHIIHGFLFYGLGWLVMRKKPITAKLALSALIEAAWEILENSPLIIDRYRAATIAYDYVGDSILNSAMDLVWMDVGFLLAWRLPVWLIVALALVAEIATALLIRDNLTLNVIMLVWPIEAIRTWQGAL